MSDRRLLLLAFAFVARPLAAQDDLALLRRRVANLEAHRAVLARGVARQDSLAREAQALQVIGAPPFQVLVPGSVAAQAGPLVAEAVAVARARFGTLIDRLPPEVLTVQLEAVETPTASGRPLESPSHLIDRLEWTVGRSIEERVRRQLPDSFSPWIGGRLPYQRPEGDRVRAINALLSDSTERGVRCLEGEIVACRAMMAQETRPSHDLRLSLVASVIERDGVEVWGKMAGSGTVEDALVRGAGVPMDSIVGRWVGMLRRPETGSGSPFAFLLGSAIGWSALLASLFLWRVKWHHA